MTLAEYVSTNKIDVLIDTFDSDKIFVQVYKNGEDMFLAFGLCEFINYMDWFYNKKVEYNKKDCKNGYLITKAEKDDGEIREDIEMFMFEYNL